ncbi:MAG: hypothetical protein J5544_06020 [Clostridia bacterium]|nr:hypothetical protein [Clostridia bacterium]
MSIKTYGIPHFIGLNQISGENRLSPVYSPDAVNIDTEGGRLRVAKGYVKFSSSKLPGSGRIDLLTCLRTADGDIPVAITGGSLYAMIDGEWVLKYTYDQPATGAGYDSATVRIGLTDYLVIADGAHQMIKFDGETVSLFGSAEGCSDIPVAYLTMYRGRLFAAGDAQNPDRIYYSVLPGSGRTVEDWGYVEASPAVEGGHAEVGPVGGDPIVAIKALSNQLLIFKKNSLYRLIGDRPSNFTIEHIDASVSGTKHTSIVTYGDMLYFVTPDGLCYYNGVTARPCPDMRLIKRAMSTARVNRSRAAIVHDTLYFTIERGAGSEMIVYDLMERKYMRRTGFSIFDIAPIDGMLMLINRNRYLYIFGQGTSYDGDPIDAYWWTPLTDLEDKACIKAPRLMLLRGKGEVWIDLELDGRRTTHSLRLHGNGDEVSELPLFGEGRCLRFRFFNKGGAEFSLDGGAEVELSLRRRTE